MNDCFQIDFSKTIVHHWSAKQSQTIRLNNVYMVRLLHSVHVFAMKENFS